MVTERLVSERSVRERSARERSVRTSEVRTVQQQKATHAETVRGVCTDSVLVTLKLCLEFQWFSMNRTGEPVNSRQIW